jgi:type IV pilus assembly protein PilW
MMRPAVGSLHREHGYTLLELMIAILIALFLLAGLLTLAMGTRKTSTTQSQLAQLQDNERIAMTLMTNVIQQAGYFPGRCIRGRPVTGRHLFCRATRRYDRRALRCPRE